MKPEMHKSVSKLTLPLWYRQSFDAIIADNGRPTSRLLMAAAIVVCLAIGTDAFAGQAWQPIDDISATAESYLRARSGDSAGTTTVRAGALDPRHRLPLCDAPLEGFMRRGAKIDARTIVGVRCTGSKPWKVYVPVDVIVTASVLAAGRPLPRGHLVASGDVSLVERDVSTMHRGYYTDIAGLTGLRLKQPLMAGQVITPAMLAADRIIRRGQTVTIVAAGGGINISMSGKALSDGALNQRIRVENSNSGRVVEGIVRSSEHVEILVSANRGSF